MNVAPSRTSEKHAKLLSRLQSLKNAAIRKNRDRVQKWEAQEKLAQGVIHLSELEKKVLKEGQEGRGQYVSVQVPYSYGQMMTAHTYFTSVFLSRNPVFQYQGVHGEGEVQEQSVESLIQYQYMRGQMAYPLFIWLYDACKYGLGVVGVYWETEYGYSTEVVEEPATYLGIPIPGAPPKKRKVTSRTLQYAGNRLYNVQPTRFIFDPAVTPAHLQEGEFCGRFYTRSWSAFKQKVAEGSYSNDTGVEKLFGLAHSDGVDSSWLSTPQNDAPFQSEKNRGFGDFLDLFVRLIPKEWDLGASEYPEIWVFTILHDTVIVQARPMGDHHCRFPFFTLEQEIEGYASYRPGIMEQLAPYNNILSWLFNSHFYNVEANLNNMIVYDPTRVRMADVLDPGPGKRIRLLPDAYGTDVRAAITQLNTYDVTQSHLSDADKVGALMQRANGIADGVMGMQAPGGRKTATEVRTATQGAMNRLKTVSEFMSHQGFTPLAQILLAQTQQRYDQNLVLRLTRDTDLARQWTTVTPESIAGAYDFVPVDGALPIDRFAQAQLYQELMLGLLQNPVTAQQFDFGQMAVWIAKLFGMKGIESFRLQPASPEAIQAQVAAGNAVPQGTQV